MNILLSVPVIPTGLSGIPVNPSIGVVVLTVLLLCSFLGLVIYREIKKRRTKTNERCRKDYGKSPIDFEHRCCFKEQIEKIGKGTNDGSGEEVEVKM